MDPHLRLRRLLDRRCLGRAGRDLGDVAHEPFEHRHEVVADRAGAADHHARRVVPLAEVVEERLPRCALDRLLRAERLPAERVRSEQQLLVHRADVVARRVDVHVHLFDDHALLALELFRVELRVAQHVDQHVECLVAPLACAPNVVARVLLRGERVELTADRVDLHRDVARRRPPLCPLEEHVLGEVRDPAVRRVLVPRPRGEHHVARDRLRVTEWRGQDAQAVRQGVTLVHAHSLSNLLLWSSVKGTLAPVA